MARRLPAALALPLALLACGGSPPEGERAEFREPGLYEITTRVGNVSRAGLSAADAAAMKRMLGDAPPSRECLVDEPPAVGGPFLGGRCRYTRVADRGTRADRAAACTPEGGTADTIEITGNTAVDGYKLRILTRRSDLATGRTLHEVETFEEARRLGPCPRRATG